MNRHSGSILVLSLALIDTLACSSTPPNDNEPVAGAAGTASTAGTGGMPSGGSGTVGGAGTGGSISPTAGSGGGGTGGAGGSSGGAGGSSGGGGGAGGSAGAGGAGPQKQWSCPAGPFGQQMQGQSTNICQAPFKFNYGYNEGPTWIKSENAFFFSNFIQGSDKGGDIIKYTLNGECEIWLHDVGCNGLAVSATGQLLGACHGPRAVMEYDVKTKQGRMVATMANGKLLDSPNDLVARSDGNIYFSNTTYELGNRPQGLGSALVRIDPMGMTSVIQMGGINGIALSPDENKLHVVQMGTWTLDAAGVPGEKGGPNPGGDGIAVDCAGNITNNGTNSAYGGPDGKTLIVVGGGTNAKIVTVTVPGLP